MFSFRCDGFGSFRTSSGRNNGSFNFVCLVDLFCFISFYKCFGMIALWMQLGGLSDGGTLNLLFLCNA